MKKEEQNIMQILTDTNLNYQQKKHYLAYSAENMISYPKISKGAKKAMDENVICDLFEGSAPYRPRYVLPDYTKALAQGSTFLELDPPKNFNEALNFLTIFYQHVPSVTGYPVFLGEIDKLLEPFAKNVSDEQLYESLKLFWIRIDRMLPDAFVHANIGPEDSRIARAVLKIERDLKQIVPNLSLKYDPEITPDSLLIDGIETVFEVGKPYIINDPAMKKDFKSDYGVASCYNSLLIGGGAHTLVRLNLKEAAKKAPDDQDKFLNEILPNYISLTSEVIKARIDFLVEKVNYFETSFLANEKVIDIDRFSAMFGIVGLAECVDKLLENKNLKYGKDKAANDFAYEVIKTINEKIKMEKLPYCNGSNSIPVLHAQSGIDSDYNVTPGARIPIGKEPELIEHIETVAPHHKYFNAGISDIMHFDQTVKKNPLAIVNVIKGSFTKGMRVFTFNIAESEFVRVSGFLVRRADLEKFKQNGARHSSTVFAYNQAVNRKIFNRKTRVLNHEQNIWINK